MTKNGLSEESSLSNGSSHPNQLNSDQSNPNPNHSFPITNHKSTRHNYLQWSQSVKMFISGRGKEEYITGEASPADSKDPSYKKWKFENHLIMSWLLNSMQTDIGENFLVYDTARDVWEVVRETYSNSNNTSKLFATDSILHDLRQGDLSVTQYFML